MDKKRAIEPLVCGFERMDSDASCILRNNHQGDHVYKWVLERIVPLDLFEVDREDENMGDLE